MFDGLSKTILWILAIVGGVVVVRRYGPRLLGMASEKQLSSSAHNPQLPVASGHGAATLVPCTAGGSPGIDPLKGGVQSSVFYRWCYVAKGGADSAGSIAESITGDTSRYVEILVANPTIPKKGVMGQVHGPDAWDFLDGAIAEGTKILIPETMNGWIDPFGRATGGYLPWPPDPRSIVAAEGHEVPSAVIGGGPGSPTVTHSAGDVHTSGDARSAAPAWGDGFDYAAPQPQGGV